MYIHYYTAKFFGIKIIYLCRQAFITVEEGYMDSLNDLLAERTYFQCSIPEGWSSYEAYKQNPDDVDNIKRINYELSSGTAAAVALIYNNKLFVANVGNCRVLLCQTDVNSVLKVVQLSVDHDLKNEDELLRLSQLGINIESLRKCNYLSYVIFASQLHFQVFQVLIWVIKRIPGALVIT